MSFSWCSNYQELSVSWLFACGGRRGVGKDMMRFNDDIIILVKFHLYNVRVFFSRRWECAQERQI